MTKSETATPELARRQDASIDVGPVLARPILLSGNHVNPPFNMYLCFCTCVFVLYITYR